jgi:hypothetical protein
MLSPEIHVMLAPRRAYAEYAPAHTGRGVWVAVRRPLFVALIQGVAVSMAATRSVAAPVVASVALCWTTALIVQLIAALVLISSTPRRDISIACALDLLFLGHAPWSLWLLAAAGALTWGPSASGIPRLAIAAMVVPAALTARIVAAFAETVLRTSPQTAIRRAILHQGLTWAALVAFIATAIQLWPRLIGMLP